MKHYLVFSEHKPGKELVKQAIEQKTGNVYNLNLLSGHEDEAEAVRGLVVGLSSMPIRPGDELIVISDDETAKEEHLAVSTTQKRFCETVKVIVVRDRHKDGVGVEIPWNDRSFLRHDDRDRLYASTNFSSSGGCGSCSGSCGSCNH